MLIFFDDYRTRLDDKNMLVIHAGSNNVYMDNATLTATIDGKDAPVEIVVRDTNRSRYYYKTENLLFSCEYQCMIKVPDNFGKVVLTATFSGEYEGSKFTYTVSGKHYRKAVNDIAGCVDTVQAINGQIKLTGWCAADEPVKVSVYKDGAPFEGCEIARTIRKDINEYFQKNELIEEAGFEILVPDYGNKSVQVVFETATKRTVKDVDISKEQMHEEYTLKELIHIGRRYLKDKGIKQTAKKVKDRLSRKHVHDYNKWINTKDVSEKELARQRTETFEYMPKYSIVIPVYRPKPEYFEIMIQSIVSQSYTNWEICVADGSGDKDNVKEFMERICNKDSRIHYTSLEKNLGISGNTNEALKMATGDFIVLGDHDDMIRPDALYECTKVLNEHPEVELIYTDEDKYNSINCRRIEPHFKSDFNLDLLRNNNYICHLFVFSKRVREVVGDFNSEFDGSQDYDYILRCIENVKTENIYHIPKVLYTWRCHENSTAKKIDSKSYAFTASIRAVEAHLKRVGIEAEVIPTDIPGYHNLKYKTLGNPLISIVIPNKDHIDDLDVCIRSICNRQTYTNYEIIIIENNSTEQSTFDYYKKIEAEFSQIKMVYYEGEFNYSRINNFGIEKASGEYILLLNNDTEMIKEDCLEHLVSVATRPEVGIVGARLLYNDNTIQHAGVIMGLGGVAGHAFTGVPGDFVGYFARAISQQNYSAVTAACLIVRKSVFYEVGGLEEDLKVAFNDVDFCLKVREAGYLIVYNPMAELYHYESKSRGTEDTPEKKERFQREIDYIKNKWGDFLEMGDPYYNVNLALNRSDFTPRE